MRLRSMLIVRVGVSSALAAALVLGVTPLLVGRSAAPPLGPAIVVESDGPADATPRLPLYDPEATRSCRDVLVERAKAAPACVDHDPG